MLKLAADEGSDIDWLSTKYNLPCGLLSFGIRAVLDVLPIRDYLKQLGKPINEKWFLYGNKGIFHYIPNLCQ